VEIVGLAVKTCIVPTGGILTKIFVESETDVFAKLPKIEVFTSEVLTEVFTTKVAKTEESKFVLIAKELKIIEHFVSIAKIGSTTEGFYSFVYEVVDTSICDVLS
jgi:translation elongation factor EF-Ts